MSGQSAVTPAAISPAPRRLHDADLVYLYDGSFEGFLCCVFESFLQHEIPFAIWTPERETATLYPIREIATDHARAQRVFASFGKKLGAETEYLVTRDFLSGREDKELLLLRFLHLAFALGPGTVKRMGHPDVAPLYEMKKSSRALSALPNTTGCWGPSSTPRTTSCPCCGGISAGGSPKKIS